MIFGFRRMTRHAQLQRLIDAAVRVGKIDFEHVDRGAARHGSPRSEYCSTARRRDHWRHTGLLWLHARLKGGPAAASQQHPMDDKSALLNQLRIDRGSETAPSGKTWLWLTAALLILAAAGIAVWWSMRPNGVPVQIATARAIAG